jgi:subtilisin
MVRKRCRISCRRERVMKNAVLALGVILVITLASTGAAQAGEPAQYIVTFTTPPTANDMALINAGGGSVRHVYSIIPGMAVLLPEAAVAGLSRNPRVASIEPDVEVFASQGTEEEYGNVWGVVRIGSRQAHDNGNTGTDVKIGIIDTGIDYTHPDLAANMGANPDEVPGNDIDDDQNDLVDDVIGYDFVNGDSDPWDDHGHGTHVAGITAAQAGNGGVIGVAPNAKIFALKVLDAEGSGSFGAVIAALDWAVSESLDVVNLSLGSTRDPGTAVETAFANAEAAGLVIVAAAGNSGKPTGKGNRVEYPARYPSVIAVAATDSSDIRASFSSTGETVELAAPGYNVYSALPGGYGVKSGTSMAAPHVAGVAALAVWEEKNVHGEQWSNAVVRQKLIDTADDLGDAGLDPWYGWGLVDAAEAGMPSGPVNAAPVVTITSPSNGAVFDSGALISFAGTAQDTEDGDLTAFLVWTSSIDGALGTGSAFSAILSDGQHVITASVTDSGAKLGSSTVSIRIGTVPTLAVTVVTDKPSYVNRETVLFTVTVTDGAAPVQGAAVHMVIHTAGGKTLAADGITGANGIALFSYKILSKRDGVGTYNADADAAKSGYDGGSGSTTFEVTR